eukprot:TRINITY_DN443_c0_g1_i1.p1 TRINITY_DN443_c0_g1~~TRINITY_DN443_c0_g1_i1.p1  ORF type:complete len:1258 (+),score=454.07 TRINITY_DN443_c0_g1_i1:178-3951(+)
MSEEESVEQSMAFSCTLCGLENMTAPTYLQHTKGRKHRTKMAAIKSLDDEDDDNDNEKTAETSKSREYNCDICGLTNLTKAQHDAHIKGSRHKRNIPKNIFSCEICGANGMDKVALENHNKGKRHQKALLAQERKAKKENKQKEEIKEKKEKEKSSTMMKSKKKKLENEKKETEKVNADDVVEEKDSDTGTYSCRFCGLKNMQRISYRNHLQGKKHAATLTRIKRKERKNESGKNSTSKRKSDELESQVKLVSRDETVKDNDEMTEESLPSKRQPRQRIPRFDCNICGLVNMKDEYYQRHLSGRKHRDNLRRIEKEKKEETTVEEESLNCELCCVAFTDLQAFQRHLDGQAHQHMIENPDGYFCEPCDHVIVGGDAAVLDHIQSDMHIISVEEAEKKKEQDALKQKMEISQAINRRKSANVRMNARQLEIVSSLRSIASQAVRRGVISSKDMKTIQQSCIDEESNVRILGANASSTSLEACKKRLKNLISSFEVEELEKRKRNNAGRSGTVWGGGIDYDAPPMTMTSGSGEIWENPDDFLDIPTETVPGEYYCDVEIDEDFIREAGLNMLPPTPEYETKPYSIDAQTDSSNVVMEKKTESHFDSKSIKSTDKPKKSGWLTAPTRIVPPTINKSEKTISDSDKTKSKGNVTDIYGKEYDYGNETETNELQKNDKQIVDTVPVQMNADSTPYFPADQRMSVSSQPFFPKAQQQQQQQQPSPVFQSQIQQPIPTIQQAIPIGTLQPIQPQMQQPIYQAQLVKPIVFVPSMQQLPQFQPIQQPQLPSFQQQPIQQQLPSFQPMIQPVSQVQVQNVQQQLQRTTLSQQQGVRQSIPEFHPRQQIEQKQQQQQQKQAQNQKKQKKKTTAKPDVVVDVMNTVNDDIIMIDGKTPSPVILAMVNSRIKNQTSTKSASTPTNPKKPNIKIQCEKCEKPVVNGKSCGRCRSVVYCSSSCKMEHYQSHKKDCDELREKRNRKLVEEQVHIQEHSPHTTQSSANKSGSKNEKMIKKALSMRDGKDEVEGPIVIDGSPKRPIHIAKIVKIDDQQKQQQQKQVGTKESIEEKKSAVIIDEKESVETSTTSSKTPIVGSKNEKMIQMALSRKTKIDERKRQSEEMKEKLMRKQLQEWQEEKDNAITFMHKCLEDTKSRKILRLSDLQIIESEISIQETKIQHLQNLTIMAENLKNCQDRIVSLIQQLEDKVKARIAQNEEIANECSICWFEMKDDDDDMFVCRRCKIRLHGGCWRLCKQHTHECPNCRQHFW